MILAFKLLVYFGLLTVHGNQVVLLAAARESYDKVAHHLWGAVGVVLFLRLIYAAMTMRGSQEIREILSDFLGFSVLILVTPSILALALEWSDQLALKIAPIESAQSGPVQPPESTGIFFSVSDIIIAGAQYWALLISKFLESIRELTIGALYASAPLFIFMGSILGFSFFRRHFFSVFFTVSLWPIFSALMNDFAVRIYVNKGEMLALDQAYTLIIYSSIQGLLPLLTLTSSIMAAGSLAKNIGGLGTTAGNVASSAGSWSLNKINSARANASARKSTTTANNPYHL